MAKRDTRACKDEMQIHRSAVGLPQGWFDLWLTKDENTEMNGATYDGATNSMVPNKTWKSRFDRMFYRGRDIDALDVVQRMQLVGKGCIGEQGGRKIYPSDHYGLFAELHIPMDIDGAFCVHVTKKRKRGSSHESAISIE